MRTYSEILEAVRDGKETTEEELQYALTLAHYLLMQLYFEGVKLTNVPEPNLSRFKRLVDMVSDFQNRDLEASIKGSSMEPGITREERIKRSSTKIADTTTRLHHVLSGIQKS